MKNPHLSFFWFTSFLTLTGFSLFFPGLTQADILQVTSLRPFSVQATHEKDVDGQTLSLENTSKFPQDIIAIEEVKLAAPFVFEKDPETPVQIEPKKKREWRIQMKAVDCTESKDTADESNEKKDNKEREKPNKSDSLEPIETFVSTEAKNKFPPQTGTLLIRFRVGQKGIDQWLNIPLLGFCKQGSLLTCYAPKNGLKLVATAMSPSDKKSLFCENQGDEPYQSKSIVVKGEQASLFTVSPQVLTLKPQEKKEIWVGFSWKQWNEADKTNQEREEGISTENLVLIDKEEQQNAHQDEEPLSIPLQGVRSHYQLMILSGDSLQSERSSSLSFGYDGERKRIYLHNVGKQKIEQLKIEVVQDPKEQIFEQSFADEGKSTLEPGENDPIFVTFHRRSIAKALHFSATLKISYVFLQKGEQQREEWTFPLEGQIRVRPISDSVSPRQGMFPSEENSKRKPESRFGIYADIGAGFLKFSNIYQSLNSQGLQYSWDSYRSNSFQPLGITRVGGSIRFASRYNSDSEVRVENGHFYFEVGGGYMNQQSSPFFETRVGGSFDMSFGRISISIPKVMMGYAYFPNPMISVLDREYTSHNTEEPPQHFFILSAALPLTVHLDQWVKQPGWQVYVEPQYVWYVAKQDYDMIGFATSLGFRHQF